MLIRLILLSSIFLTGCSVFGSKDVTPTIPEVKVITKEVPLQILQPKLPRQITLNTVEWFVLTRDNIDEKIEEIEKYQGGDFVVFAITPQGYENMAENLKELRRYILQQKEIIL